MLSYVNVFAQDIHALSRFYIDIFGFEEIAEIASPIFVGIRTGQSNVGFNAPEVYGLLQIEDRKPEAGGAKFLLNFDVESIEAVERMTEKAVARGAVLIKSPCRTYYNWYQSVLADIEDNIFRINHVI
ncbi:Glyoxalase/bleomycin resistance protein/dioxygenase [Methylorubrum populi BJ001]|jgi:catechol 2,3-dioxygenase-like lactoylglutathione lyase family enzyme|uniref:Glyoxalase/bleomycin resistance protein/dioxygenase n=1 Tax=Methylorubrum populi (strain ATCC BAA-705 / NCIMB 13946 / BJ001) TaxID=441620 RepID=B1ZES5_METPB|nr:VOC family protein [Methylorubrum populi]ACB82454.1 Glyoxalase/bleomycin resistance protein/dioxygenase [Methylorubrum populi BJ001]PZP70158.1 MAG: glyoxalase/bleomycin resistance/dioxygenase family protein [Methylorubrum populi]